jgi:hypothetical protein
VLSAQANGGHCQDTDDAHCIVCGVEEQLRKNQKAQQFAVVSCCLLLAKRKSKPKRLSSSKVLL